MSRQMIAVALLCALAWSTRPFAVPVASAASKAERERAASEKVQTALRAEIEGKNSERSQSLESALDQVPEFAPAMWHRGFVRHSSQWLRFDEVPDVVADDQRLVAYGRLRQKAPDTAPGQLELARWCSKNRLSDRARAHLTRVLDLEPDHPEARRLLGYRKVEGVWLSEQEVKAAAARAADVATALKQWKPRLQEILEGLTHRSQKQRELAREKLLAIDDPAAIPALELTLATQSEDLALLMVQVLDGIDAPEAAPALARQAVFSRWERVREAAAENLKSRDPASYVPMLLSAMVTPIQTRAELFQAPNGRLTYRHLLYREGKDQGQLAVFESEYRRTLLSPSNEADYAARRQLLAGARQMDAIIKAQTLEAAVAEQNAFIEKLNERICWVLSKAIGLDLGNSSEAWWKWWNDYNGVYVSGEKPIEQAYQRQTVEFEDPSPTYVRVGYSEPTAPTDYPDSESPTEPPTNRSPVVHETGSPMRHGNWWGFLHARRSNPGSPRITSCLVPGTPVWSASGLIPIEQLQVGDLVLSQNPQTGELTYKPVLKTTVRPPVQMLKIVFAGKALQCSGGHPFWVAGKGWVFARDLKQGMPLHAVDGAAEVRSVHPTAFEELHNLVVADFHTYFVTEAKILTHDNTIRQPTKATVPGLAGR